MYACIYIYMYIYNKYIYIYNIYIYIYIYMYITYILHIQIDRKVSIFQRVLIIGWAKNLPDI